MPKTTAQIVSELSKEVLELSTQWSLMKNEFDDMKTREANNAKKLDRILMLLENDDRIGSTGLVKQVAKNTQQLKTWQDKASIIIFIVSGAASIGWWAISQLFN